MSINHHGCVGTSLGLLHKGLYPYVKQKMTATYGSAWLKQASYALPSDINSSQDAESILQRDVLALLIVIWVEWHNVFKNYLSQSERTLVSELRSTRNDWAHSHTISAKDAYRALDSMTRLLFAVSAPEAKEVEKLANELIFVIYHDVFDQASLKSSNDKQDQFNNSTEQRESSSTDLFTLWSEESVRLINVKDFDAALIAIEQAIDLDSTSFDTWYKKGDCLLNLKKYEEAIISYEKAIEINPNNADFWNNKGVCLLTDGHIFFDTIAVPCHDSRCSCVKASNS